MARTSPAGMALMVPGVVCLALALAVGVPLLPWVADQAVWTPATEARPLTEEHERVEMLLDGRSLELAITEGELRRRDGSPLRAHEILVRFNDSDRVGRIRLALCAALAAAGLVLLAVGAVSAGGRDQRGGHG